MKKISLLIIALWLSLGCFAQDVIVTKDGKKINAKVTEIHENAILYKKFENLEDLLIT